MSDARKVLRVFVSSTATDLEDYRQRVTEAILQLDHQPVAMRTFTARPDVPAQGCCELAAGADAVVVLVAHRYGFVPLPERGGDGKRSITWLEVDAALGAGKPVFAFLIDPSAAWDRPKEQDRLVSDPEKVQEILAAVQGLKQFRDHLGQRVMCRPFHSLDHLLSEVTAALARWRPGAAATAKPVERVWWPRVCYPLQPAPHFQGRERLRAELVQWARAPVSPDRVVSLVAVGGTGKTALTERVLAELSEQPPAGVLVWSFDEDPRTEAFLRAACEYFTGETPSSAGGLLERLQTALRGDEPHLLVLDGLERVQAEGTTDRPRGELEDPQLRRLLRWLAAGLETRTRALVTTRFPLPDLADWMTTGFREDLLDDLDAPAARAVLRKWGVQGDDDTLDALTHQVHQHALTVDVLGSYLGTFCNGNPDDAPTFNLSELEGENPKAARLARVLQSYATRLLNEERDLLTRLSALSGGVPVEFLTYLTNAGGLVAGSLAGSSRPRLLQLLERLRKLGLVFRYEATQGTAFSAHPFLRDFFKKLLGVIKPATIHETIRFRLAQSLEVRPARRPTDAGLLDRYEVLIEYTCQAGKVRDAYQLFKSALGGYSHLGKTAGENVRGSRILAGFLRHPHLAAELTGRDRSDMLVNVAMFDRNLGKLTASASALSDAAALARKLKQPKDEVVAHQLLSDVYRLAGRLSAAKAEAQLAVKRGPSTGDELTCLNGHVYLAFLCGLLGQTREARKHFQEAAEVGLGLKHAKRGRLRCEVREAEWKLLMGHRTDAMQQLFYVHKLAKKSDTERDWVLCELLLGQLFVTEDVAAARGHLAVARGFASRSGNVEVALRAYQLATAICRHAGDWNSAFHEVEAGLQLAELCGFGLYAIELRLALARVYLDASDPKAALQRAREALDHSVHPECQYAWGEADGLHLCGVAHARLGETELARQRLSTALAKREQLTHPGLPETRAELAKLGGQP